MLIVTAPLLIDSYSLSIVVYSSVERDLLWTLEWKFWFHKSREFFELPNDYTFSWRWSLLSAVTQKPTIASWTVQPEFKAGLSGKVMLFASVLSKLLCLWHTENNKGNQSRLKIKDGYPTACYDGKGHLSKYRPHPILSHFVDWMRTRVFCMAYTLAVTPT